MSRPAIPLSPACTQPVALANSVKNTSGAPARRTTWRNTTSVTASIGAKTKNGCGKSFQNDVISSYYNTIDQGRAPTPACVDRRERGGMGVSMIYYRSPPFWGRLLQGISLEGILTHSWDGRSRTCYESSHECLSPLTSKPLVPRNHAGHPRSVTIDRLSSQKLKPEQCRRVLCKGRDNCNLPSENCQVVSASEFYSYTTVMY